MYCLLEKEDTVAGVGFVPSETGHAFAARRVEVLFSESSSISARALCPFLSSEPRSWEPHCDASVSEMVGRFDREKKGRSLPRAPISVIQYGSRSFRLNRPLELNTRMDDETGLLFFEFEPLGICIGAADEQGLMEELAEEICVLWDEYACEEDDNLSPAAIRLKRRLLEDVKEIEVAEGEAGCTD